MDKLVESFKDKKIFITGHTGFVGSNLSLFLNHLQAKVIGYSNKEFEIKTKVYKEYVNEDVTDYIALYDRVQSNNPDCIIHLAAQPLVKESYRNPRETYDVNVNGTLNVLEVAKELKIPCLIITTDKVYKNKEKYEGYEEHEELGGYDPYSNSKSCCELIVETYRNCFFNNLKIPVAVARAGNIIGGGDFGKDRLIPDIIRCWQTNTELEIRSPHAVRPWTYIFDICYGYILLTEKLLNNNMKYSDAFNFASNEERKTVLELIKGVEKWVDFKYNIKENSSTQKETNILYLSSKKVRKDLGWKNIYSFEKMINDLLFWNIEYIRNEYDYRPILLRIYLRNLYLRNL